MFTIEKIWIHSLAECAYKIAQNLPVMEPEFDSYGEWSDTTDFDIEIDCGSERLAVMGTISGNGEAKKVQERTHEHPELWETTKIEKSIDSITFYTSDGSEIEVDNEFELIQEIDKLI